MDIFDLSAIIRLDSSQYESKLDSLKGSIGTIAKVGGAALTAATGAVVSATTAFVSGVGNVAEYGDNIDKMSQKMGMSAEAFQEWDAIMQHSGTSMETMKAGMKTLANAVENGNEAFQRIGLTQEQIASMSQEELFGATIKGLQNVDNETERTYLAGQLLGRGATELGALLNTSAEDTEAMRQRVHELGGVMSDEAVKASAAYQDSLQDMQTAFSGLQRNLMSEFLPSITTVMDGLSDIFSGNSESGIEAITTGLNDLFDEIGEMVPKVAKIATKIITALSQAFIEALPDIVESVFQIAETIMSTLTENASTVGNSAIGIIDAIIAVFEEYTPTLIEQGMLLLTNIAMGIIENAPALLDSLSQGVDQMLAFLEEHLPDFIDKGYAAIEQLASGILENLPSAITSIGEIVTNLVTFLMEHLPDFLQKGIELLGNLAKGILDNLPEIISAGAEALANLLAEIGEHFPDFIDKGFELLGQVATGIINAVPDLLAEIPGILQDVASKFMEHDWLSIGSNIIAGIADGVVNAAQDLANAALDAVSNAWDAMTGWLGIKSPSRKAKRVIGRNWALGIGEGFEENFPENSMTGVVESAMKDMQNALSTNPFDVPVTATVEGSSSRNNGGDINAALYELLVQYLPQLSADRNIYFNDGTWAGRLAPTINEELGRIAQWEAAQ